MPETMRLTPFIRVPAPDDGAELRYCQEAVDQVLRFFGLLVFGQNEWAGKPFALLPWQEQIIREFYGVQVRDDDGRWVRYRRFSYNEIPKKNGKSELAAGLGLYHLLADGESRPNVGVFAVDKQNADIIYQCAKYMVENTALSEPAYKPLAWCRDSVREIRTRFGGVMKVYSGDVENKHGPSFSAILCDELHAWKGRKGRALWNVLTTGSDAARRQQTVLVLTTAGDDPDRASIGWEIHEKCRRILAWRQGRPERPQDADDPEWLPVMYGVSVLTGDDPDRLKDLDIYDEELWKACNPSYGVTMNARKFRAAARAADMKRRASSTRSRQRRIARVRRSAAKWSRQSEASMSRARPRAITAEKPTPRRLAHSTMAAATLPDCETRARSPAAGAWANRLASRRRDGTLSPALLGPSRRRPCRRARIRACGPGSPGPEPRPALRTRAAPAPSRPASSTRSGT